MMNQVCGEMRGGAMNDLAQGDCPVPSNVIRNLAGVVTAELRLDRLAQVDVLGARIAAK